jgi:hypothetical protein
MRRQLLTAITSATSTLTQFAVAQELPWSQNGSPLFRKNMKRIYLDRDVMTEVTLIPTLDAQDVMQNDLVVTAYLAVDAKTVPTQLDQAVTQILAAKNAISIVNSGLESDYTIEVDEDVLVYTFEFRMNTIT